MHMAEENYRDLSIMEFNISIEAVGKLNLVVCKANTCSWVSFRNANVVHHKNVINIIHHINRLKDNHVLS